MLSFDVLSEPNIHQSRFLEASAGTGKTFAIENIVVRLLLEAKKNGTPLTLDQVLVVTFTRAATRDLRVRIREALENALEGLKQWQKSSQSVPRQEYLRNLCSQGEEAVQEAKMRLEQALFCFDEAQIFTIHGFCFRMLRENPFEGDVGLSLPNPDNALNVSDMLIAIKDFFRTEVKEDIYSPQQLKILLSNHDNEMGSLACSLAKEMSKQSIIAPLPNFTKSFNEFVEAMRRLKGRFAQEALRLQVPGKEVIARLFEQEQWTPDDFDELLKEGEKGVRAPEEKKGKKKGEPLKEEVKHFLGALEKELLPIVKRAGNYSYLFSRAVYDSRQLLQNIFSQEEKMTPDDLLRVMEGNLKNQEFCRKIRDRYQAALIDEFQDTDPLQWSLFSKLFLSGEGQEKTLYLLGDPKQSIYAFRNADIYTYLEAALAIGHDRKASLDTNYRSQPTLVEALNTLFSSKNVPRLIEMPQSGHLIECPPVKSSGKSMPKVFEDGKGSVHFFIAEIKKSRERKWPSKAIEEAYFYPYIATELQELHQKQGIAFGKCAILVRDRHQARNLQAFLKQSNIPALTRRSRSLVDSPALPALKDVLNAAIHPRERSYTMRALGGVFLGWNHEEIRNFYENPRKEKLLAQFYFLRGKLFSEGFSSFLQSLLHSCWQEDQKDVAQRLLAREGGIDIYEELLQLSELIIEQQNLFKAHPESILRFLDDDLAILELNDDERVKVRLNSEEDAVNILTLHMSKGLEFDVVFALGLMNRTYREETVISVFNKGTRVLKPFDESDPSYEMHCQEIDAEKMRLFYVAMTRARYRVYAPVLFDLSHKAVEKGLAAPMELFLARLGQEEADYSTLYSRIGNLEKNHLHRFVEAHREEKLSSEILNRSIQASIEETLLPQRAGLEKELCLPRAVLAIPGEPLFINSFSSLATTNTPLIEKEMLFPHDPFAEKTVHTLPAGREVGNFLHRIFQEVDWRAVTGAKNSKEISPLTAPFLIGSRLENWNDIFAEIIYNAFHMPLRVGNEDFKLADVDERRILREMEFLFPAPNQIAERNQKISSGAIVGVMDMLFQHEGIYYLLDWKSNWLGPACESYNRKNLESSMQENDYFLQAFLYTEALKRYLRVVEQRPFEECFGGVFYLFLRGMNASDASHGVYHFYPEKTLCTV